MFDMKKIEKKWRKYWEDNKTFKTDVYDFSKPKYYVLDMFPYPSGSGLHAGHTEGYTASDIVARFKRLQGYNVLHPIGFDSFGLPAEQYAIKTGNHPNVFTNKNIETFRNQLKLVGFSYDWDREISTCDPKYYKWTQWIFKLLVENDLAKIVDMPVNWCEELGTVLSNDEIIDGKSERGGYPVVRKNMRQWIIDIPRYADILLDGLDDLDWPESTKEIQRNWIGKSVGAEIEFKVNEYSFKVFTTRCDTIFGATYCVMAPENELVDKITTDDRRNEVDEYKRLSSLKSDLERTELNKEKTGVFTGSYAINPVNNKKIPIWISDYVLSTYGTGSIMAVPAHDDRDYEFAKKYNLEIIPVLEGGDISNSAYTKDGLHINSDFLNGMNKEDAINKMLEYLENNEIGKKKVNYRLRNWIFARQRYWGEPIPVIHYEDGSIGLLREEDLPLILPELEDYSPKNSTSPLENAKEWINTTYDGKKGRRESATMPSSAASSWYFIRYLDPNNDKYMADSELIKHWLPVDLYLGGPEHAVGHLLYSRFFNNFLYDKGLVYTKEPFKKLVHQGMVLGSNNIKMGKRYPEYSVNPNDIVEEYGADTLRMYEMFMGPLEADKPWSNQGVEGIRKFIDRIVRLYTESDKIKDIDNNKLDKVFNETVKKITEDYENLRFNTSISQMMIFINAVYKEEIFPKDMAEKLLILMNPIIPFTTEELWNILGHHETIAYEKWPIYDAEKIISDEKEIGVQVNGKLRGTIVINVTDSLEEVKNKAFSLENVKIHTENKEIVKVIVIKDKIVNIVVK